MCWNLDDAPVSVPLDHHPATAREIGRTLIEMVLIVCVFLAAFGLAEAIFGSPKADVRQVVETVRR